MTKFDIKVKAKTVKKKITKKVDKNPPLVKREYVEIPNLEFVPTDKVKIDERFDGLYNNIEKDKSYLVLETIDANLGNMNCGVIYLKEYPKQPFVSHHFTKA